MTGLHLLKPGAPVSLSLWLGCGSAQPCWLPSGARAQPRGLPLASGTIHTPPPSIPKALTWTLPLRQRSTFTRPGPLLAGLQTTGSPERLPETCAAPSAPSHCEVTPDSLPRQRLLPHFIPRAGGVATRAGPLVPGQAGLLGQESSGSRRRALPSKEERKRITGKEWHHQNMFCHPSGPVRPDPAWLMAAHVAFPPSRILQTPGLLTACLAH